MWLSLNGTLNTFDMEIEEFDAFITRRRDWLNRTTRTVWKLIAVLVALIIIANVLNYYA